MKKGWFFLLIVVFIKTVVFKDINRKEFLPISPKRNLAEENAVCYLQIVLAEQFPQVGRARMQHDMDCWGYSFRLGSAQAWFEQDAQDTLQWLLNHQILDNMHTPRWRLRET